LISALMTAACGSRPTDSTPPLCLAEPADATCTNALYGFHNGVLSPTFDDVFTNTLSPTCGTEKCHVAGVAPNGLELDMEDLAYTDLMAENAAGTEKRVIPGDTKCGEMIVRIETHDRPWSMPLGQPPGLPLDDGTLCAIRHWIANGAQRQ